MITKKQAGLNSSEVLIVHEQKGFEIVHLIRMNKQASEIRHILRSWIDMAKKSW